MEAKDTVMTRLWLGENSTFVSETTKLLEQQAEMSFKAGIREVVEAAIEDTRNFEVPLSLGFIAKLREWGVK